MIAKVTRGREMGRLVRYLFSEQGADGRHNEHADPRVIAGDGALGVDDGQRLSKGQVSVLARAMEAPSVLYGTEVAGGQVWHVSLSTKGGTDRELSDREWAEIARDAVSRLGFAGAEDAAPCRWVAVRHGRSGAGNDHMHIAVNLVREDGRAASTSNDYRKLSRLCRDMEARYGLSAVEGRLNKAGMPGLSRAEQEKAARVGRADPERVELARCVRAAATAAGSEAEFVRRLRAAGLAARPRYDRSAEQAVVGYSVAQAPSDGGAAVFFGGAKLAKDLSLSALRARWATGEEARLAAAKEWGERPASEAHAPSSREGRHRRVYRWGEAQREWGRQEGGTVASGPEAAVYGPEQWAEAAVRLGAAVRQMAAVPIEDADAWRAAASDAAGIAASLSGRLEVQPGPLARASDLLARSAQGPAPSPPAAALPSGTLRTVVAVMAQSQITDEVAMAWQLLLSELLRLAQALQQAHLARSEAQQAARLAGEARAALEEARARFGSVERVRALLPELVERAQAAAAEVEDDRDDDKRRRGRGGLRPEDYAALAARQGQPRHQPSRETSR